MPVETTSFDAMIKRVAKSKDLPNNPAPVSQASEITTSMDSIFKRVSESKDLRSDSLPARNLNETTTDMSEILKRAQTAPGAEHPEKPLMGISTSMDQVLKRVNQKRR